MSELSTLEKYKIILKRFGEVEDGILTAYDKKLKEDLKGMSEKQIGRLLQDLERHFDGIVKIEKKDRKQRYKLLNHKDIFIQYFKNNPKLEWLFSLAKEADPEILKDLEKFSNPYRDIFIFKNSPFEDLSSLKEQKIFDILQQAVKNRRYIKLIFKNEIVNKENPKVVNDAKALKLVFIDGNWYIAYIDTTDRLRFGRVSFIEDVEYTKWESFQPSATKKHIDFIKNNLQNSMTLYGIKPKKALIKATPTIAKYFKKGMKKFLLTQSFEKELEDGSVIFSLKYTQELEILPFIQKWLPDLVILEPQELKKSYIKKLKLALQYLEEKSQKDSQK